MILKKMKSQVDGAGQVQYSLDDESSSESLNTRLGHTMTIKASGQIFCLHCQQRTKQSYQQGYCYSCSQRLARCDSCIVRPELCHFHRGSCREPAWAEQNCMISHTIYLANSSGLKVGITRSHQTLTRWIDQGASQAIALARVATRLQAGMIEVALKEFFQDKTNWRKMLQGEPQEEDMHAIREEAIAYLPTHPHSELAADTALKLNYPVLSYPQKVVSFNLEKKPLITGTLLGIKGQYLIFDSGVINIRSYSGYEVEIN